MSTPVTTARAPVEVNRELLDVFSSAENTVKGRSTSINQKLDQLQYFLRELIAKEKPSSEE